MRDSTRLLPRPDDRCSASQYQTREDKTCGTDIFVPFGFLTDNLPKVQRPYFDWYSFASAIISVLDNDAEKVFGWWVEELIF